MQEICECVLLKETFIDSVISVLKVCTEDKMFKKAKPKLLFYSTTMFGDNSKFMFFDKNLRNTNRIFLSRLREVPLVEMIIISKPFLEHFLQ